MTSESTPKPPLPRNRIVRTAARIGFSVAIFLITLEVSLRLVGFEHRRYIARVRDNQFKAVVAEFKQHPDSIWGPKPDTGPFNSLGYIGPEVSLDRTAGKIRIACLGDSCTQFGDPAYPALVAKLLEDRGYDHIEMMNWGVAGFTSFQGMKRLEHEVLAFRPDIFLIAFGWNDHWIRAGFPDDVSALRSLKSGPVWSAVEESRLAQATDLLVESFRRPRRTLLFRVPLGSYRENVCSMIRMSRDSGGKVMLITAADCLIDDRPIQNHLEGLNSLGYSSAAAVHADYVEATRAIAAELDCNLFDAARYFKSEISGCDYFLPERDPVHLTQAGLEVLASQVTKHLLATGWLE